MQMARSRAQPIKCEYFWRLTNQESVNLSSLERKLGKNALCLNQSAISNFALCVIKAQFATYLSQVTMVANLYEGITDPLTTELTLIFGS